MQMAAILIGLGALLSGLLAVANVQRRRAEALGSPGTYVTGQQSAFNMQTSQPPPTSVPMSIGRIALGVWLGLWLFVFTAAIPAVIIFRQWVESR
jgi:hypothetical protein